MLRNLGLDAIPLHGQMTQAKRLGALDKFKGKIRSILIATDVASRGLDIPHVDVVINFDIPTPPQTCLLYTSPSPRDRQKSRMPSSA